MGSDADVDALLRELASMFVVYHQGCLIELQTASEGGDYASIERLAHTLKGSAATLGATVLSERCGALRKSAQTLNEDDVTRCIERVTSAFKQVANELSAYM